MDRHIIKIARKKENFGRKMDRDYVGNSEAATEGVKPRSRGKLVEADTVRQKKAQRVRQTSRKRLGKLVGMMCLEACV